MYHTETMPVVQLLPKNMTYLTSVDMPFSTTGPKPGNIQWPYYPQSGKFTRYSFWLLNVLKK